MNLPNNYHSLLQEFSSFLISSGLSAVSVKNYLSDLRNFFAFLELNGNPNPQNLYLNISKYTKEYQNTQRDLFTPANTTNRRLASIRRLTTYLKATYFIDSSTPIDQPDQNTSSSPVATSPTSSQKIIDQFQNYLKSEKKTHSTIKNYCSDLYHYFNWIAKHTPYNTHHLGQILSKQQLDSYTSFLKLSQTTSSVINRRQSSIKRLTHFCHKQGYIELNPFEYIQPDTKLSPLSWLVRHLPKPKNPSNAPKSRLAKAYYNYHQLPFTPYLHLALLVIATTTMALLAYNQVIKNAKPSLAGTSLVRPKRQLSFQGRLSDSVGTPIVTTVNVNFKLWDQLAGGTEGTCTGGVGEDCLYKTGTCSITPDNQGVFNSLIGDGVCGSEIPASVFSDHQDIFLEVGVGAETLTPRQQIATVGYALNSETLQGYPAANPATINSVPVIDNNGDINISVASPSIISSSGNFNIQGQSLSLTTATGTGGDIVLQPDAIGAGQILALGATTTEDTFRITNANLTSGSLISGYIGNDVATGSGNLLQLSSGATETAKFRVTADGRTTITTATASANTSALTIDQNGTGNILSASASGISKFTIDNLGRIILLDGVSHTFEDITGDLTISSNSNTISLNDSVTFASTTTLNGQTYTWPASAGSNGYALTTNGSGTLSWQDQTTLGTNYWDHDNHLLFPKEYWADDLVIGGNSTASAKFQVLATTGNISTVNQTIDWTLNDAIDAINFDSNTLSIDALNERVGIGTSSPQTMLDIGGVASIISFSGTAGGGGEGISYTDSGFSRRVALSFPGSNVVALSNRASNGVVQVRANTSTAGSGGEVTVAEFQDDRVLIQNSNLGVNTTGPDRKLDVLDASSPQMRLTQTDGSVYADFQVDNNGDLIVGVDGTTNQLVLDNAGNVGIGTSTPDRLLHAESNSASTNSVTYLQRLTSMSTGTAANGIGSGLEFETEDSAGNAQLAAAIDGILSNATSTKEQGSLIFKTADLGAVALNEAARFTNQGDLVTNGHIDIQATANANDIFVYDTTTDTDGGAWRNDGRAKSTSWFNETLDDSAGNCDIATNDRCGRREFPEKAFIIATNSNIFIFDAKDNYMWMRFDQNTNYALGVDANNNPSSVHAQNGKIYVGTNGSSATGAYIIDLKLDKITRINTTDARDFGAVISARNTAPSGVYTDQLRTGMAIINATVNDIFAKTIKYTNGGSNGNGRSYLAVGTDAGVSIVKETDQVTYDYTDNANDDYNQVVIDDIGNLWTTNETTGTLEKWALVTNDTSDESPGTPDDIWDETTTPALANAAPTIQVAPTALYLTEGTSTVDSKSPTIYLGTDLGLTALNTKYNDETNGSVKYYTKDFISEELIGDIRGMWALNGSGEPADSASVSDTTVKGNTLKAENDNDGTDLTYATGVRGTAIDFAGDDYLWQDTDTDGVYDTDGTDDDTQSDFDLGLSGANFTFGAWVKLDDISTIRSIIAKGDWSAANTSSYRLVHDPTTGFELRTSSASTVVTSTVGSPASTGKWYHVVGVFNNTSNTQSLYVDGILADTDARTNNINNSAGPILIGATGDSTSTPVQQMDGSIDEPFVTAETLTLPQIKKMYQVGLRALQNHTSSRITGVTGADNYQRLMGNASGGTSTATKVFGVAIDNSSRFAYVGLNDTSTATGGVTVLGLDSDTALDLYDNTVNTTKTDDATTQFNASDVRALSVSGTPCSIGYNASSTNCQSQITLGVVGENSGGTTTSWLETTDYSLYSALAQVSGSNLNKNSLTINNSFQIFNTANNSTNSTTAEESQTPSLSIDSFGNVVYNYSGPSVSATAWDINDTVLTTGTLFDIDSTALTSGEVFNASANALTSGSIVELTSTSTSFTGALTDITLSGSNAANTGSLIRLTNSGTLNTNTSLYVRHYANGTGSLAFKVDDESSDATPFVIDANGNVGVGDSSPDHKLDVDGNIGLTASSYLNWGDTTGTSGYGFRDNAGNLEFKNSSGAWTGIGTGGATYWEQQNGSLYSLNSTVDLLVGGQATTSAKFAILNIDSGTPVASISSGLAGVSSYLTADGILATTNNQTLTIGSSATGNIAIGTGSKTLNINSSTWDITAAGVASGLTGLTSSGTINFSGLSASSAVYTDGSSNLTSIAPTTGILGFWQRSSGTLSPWFITDSVNIGASATSSALVHLGGTAGESSFFMEPVAIGFNSALTNPGIGGGTTALQVDGDILPGADDDAFLGRASTAWNRLYLSNGINNSAGTEQINILNRNLTGGQWNATSTFRVGDTTKSMPTGIEFYTVGDASVSATFTAGGNSRIIGSLTIDGTTTIGGGTGKLDVGTVDPPYTINGEKYATYLSGMIGVKEETTGNIITDEYIENLGYRKTINFSSQAKGSDLWLFSKTTNLKNNFDHLSVLLTPSSQAKTWYEIDKNKNTLYVYSSSPGNISYRLSAPRFDAATWTNTRTSGVQGFVLNDEDDNLSENNSVENFNYSAQIERIDGQFALLINNEEKKDISNFSNSLIANLRSGIAVINDLFVDNLVVKNNLVSPLANIDQLTAIDATISGTLTADNIQGKTIDKLNEQLGILNDKYSTAAAILASIQENINPPLSLSPISTTSGQLPEELTNDTLTLQTLYTSDILANGSIFTQSLSSFETDLFIQPTGDKPVHILANLLNLYPNGQIVINGDLLVTGNIFANNLDTRTATISGTLALGANSSPLATDSGKLLAIFGNQGEEVSSIDASGSANFNTLKTNGLVIASQNGSDSSISGTTTSNATIGTATIATNSAEIFIQNNQVNSQTLIYITPISDTNNQVLFVKSKQTCNNQPDCIPGFTVAVPQVLPKETSFNYWLVQTK